MKTKTFVIDGKRYYIRGETDKEIEKKMLEKIASVKAKPLRTHYTVKTWSDICIKTYKRACKNITYDGYVEKADRLINQYIGNIALNELTPLDCQNCLNNHLEKSQYTIDQCYILLNFILNRAVDNELIPKNPAKNIRKPNGTKTERRALTDIERKLFLEALDERTLIFELMYYTGVRPNEACKLKGVNIDHQNKLLRVPNTKTSKPDRYIPLPNALYEKIKNTASYEHICTTPLGYEFDKHRINNMWYYFRKRASLPPDLVPYCLRHDYCTRLCEQGVTLQYASYLMGNSIEIAQKIYTHIDKAKIVKLDFANAL